MTITENQYDELADLVSRLRAENAALRAAGQAVVNEWGEPWQPMDDLAFEEALDALRAALKEGGGE
jgi:hypothetical protein